MIKPIILLIVVLGIGAVGGYFVGTKHPSVGDCVNSVIGS
ncbi:hypothetical protein GAP32_483 [Cronobacter phage vB_CsaM_GAP32]|uniref:Uncharacterized protein n=1 Tax=Cronobacter phage vB_CsaM_GAP32 TaxID=1141136 RepID=K4F6N9_9CAUD|nr:hypothetical protein GAP32_483 [Cronobacter phage vB_CsaM_GAP32]AFC21941.1 hypothetical protein GAP32_483 [Cronobacter phage vB_CsaM_GAP32]